MKKKLFTLTAATMLLLGMSLAACQNKQEAPRHDMDDDTEEVEEGTERDRADETTQKREENEAEADEATQSARAFLSADLATFHLYGSVSLVQYGSGDQTVSVSFNRDGSLQDISKLDSERNISYADVERDGFGHIISIAWEEDSPWIETFSYEGEIAPPTLNMSSNQMGNYQSYAISYDANGQIDKIDYEEAVHGNVIVEQQLVVTLSNIDSHGNWRKCILTDSDGEETNYERGVIWYFDE